MQCFARFCAESGSRGITFYKFPSGRRDCEAWLQALGRQGCSVPRDAVVCSQHFLAEDFCDTRRGAKQLRPGVVPFVITDDVKALSGGEKQRRREVGPLHPVSYNGDMKSKGVNSMIEDDSNVVLKQEITDKATDTDSNYAFNAGKIFKQEMCNDGMRHSSDNNNQLSFLSFSTSTKSNDLYLKEHTVSVINTRKCKGSNGNNLASIKLKTLVIALERCDEALKRRMTPSATAKALNSSLSIPGTVSLDTKNPSSTDESINAKRLFICDICNRCCQTRKGFLYHLETHTGKKRFTCDICEYKCLRKPTLDRHMLKHNGEKKFSCPYCTKKFVLKNYLVSHIRSHTHELPVSCDLCDYRCNAKPSLKLHKQSKHSGTKNFSCEICAKDFALKGSLVQHIRTHTEKQYLCDQCPFKTSSNGILLTHKITHTGLKKHVCNVCKHKFSTNYGLTRHMRTHTGDKPFCCAHCDHKFARKCTLIDHMRVHTGEKPYTCTVCQKKFTTGSSLGLHMRIHNREKKFQCKVCHSYYLRKSYLKIHMSYHTGDKRYSCKICAYKCAQSSHLNVHMRMHTGERPFTCNDCDYKCSSSQALIIHTRTHTGEKPYACGKCGGRFATSSSRAAHSRRIHSLANP